MPSQGYWDWLHMNFAKIALRKAGDHLLRELKEGTENPTGAYTTDTPKDRKVQRRINAVEKGPCKLLSQKQF